MTCHPSHPSEVGHVTGTSQYEIDRELVQIDPSTIEDPDLKAQTIRRQQKAAERLYGGRYSPPPVHVSNRRRPSTPEEKNAAEAFNRRLNDMRKESPVPGLHLTYREFTDACDDDPEGYAAWRRTQHTLVLRPDPDDLT